MKLPTEWKNKIHVPNHQPDIQWSFQEPKKLELPTRSYHISGLFFRAKFQGISPQNLAQNMVPGTSIESDLEIPIDILGCHNFATIAIGFGHKESKKHMCMAYEKYSPVHDPLIR